MQACRLVKSFQIPGSVQNTDDIESHDFREGKTQENATKIWITRNGHCSKAHNRSKIPEATLNNIIRIIEVRIPEIDESKCKDTFGQISYFC